MARNRTSLREFQQSLSERLVSARRGETSRAMLGILSGQENWLLDLADAGELIPLVQLTPVPLTKPWFRGIANIRGVLYSVVDFSAFQGGEPTQISGNSRLLLAGSRYGINCALLISRTLGLKNPDDIELQPERSDERPWVGEQAVDSQNIVWKKLVLKNLLGQQQFLDIGN